MFIGGRGGGGPVWEVGDDYRVCCHHRRRWGPSGDLGCCALYLHTRWKVGHGVVGQITYRQGIPVRDLI